MIAQDYWNHKCRGLKWKCLLSRVLRSPPFSSRFSFLFSFLSFVLLVSIFWSIAKKKKKNDLIGIILPPFSFSFFFLLSSFFFLPSFPSSISESASKLWVLIQAFSNCFLFYQGVIGLQLKRKVKKRKESSAIPTRILHDSRYTLNWLLRDFALWKEETMHEFIWLLWDHQYLKSLELFRCWFLHHQHVNGGHVPHSQTDWDCYPLQICTSPTRNIWEQSEGKYVSSLWFQNHFVEIIEIWWINRKSRKNEGKEERREREMKEMKEMKERKTSVKSWLPLLPGRRKDKRKLLWEWIFK